MISELYDSLDGQVVLLAGADGGVGAAVADELLGRGATLYVGSADGTVFSGGIPLALDLTDSESIGAAVGRVVGDRGRLDVLVLLPAVSDRRDWSLLEASIDTVDAGIARTFRGPLLLVRAALPYLLEHDGGRVVTVSADDTTSAHPADAAVQVSTAAFDAFASYLDATFAPRLIANNATPGRARADGGHCGRGDPTESSAETVGTLARLRPGSDGGLDWSDCRAVGN